MKERSSSSPATRTPEAPPASTSTQSFVDVEPSTVMALKLSSAAIRSGPREQFGRHRCVGRDLGERRRHVGGDHAGALGEAADAHGAAGQLDLACRELRARVGGQDRVGRISASVRRERARRRSDSALGRRHLEAGVRSRPVWHTSTSWASIPSAAAVREAIAHASRSPCAPVQAFALPLEVTIARARAVGQVLAAELDAGRAHEVAGEDAGGGGGAVADDERQVAGAVGLDPAGDTGRRKAARVGDAHRPSPRAVRPSVSSSPSMMLALCNAWPAAPLTRLSMAAATIALPGALVRPHADVARVRAVQQAGVRALGDGHERLARVAVAVERLERPPGRAGGEDARSTSPRARANGARGAA